MDKVCIKPDIMSNHWSLWCPFLFFQFFVNFPLGSFSASQLPSRILILKNRTTYLAPFPIFHWALSIFNNSSGHKFHKTSSLKTLQTLPDIAPCSVSYSLLELFTLSQCSHYCLYFHPMLKILVALSVKKGALEPCSAPLLTAHTQYPSSNVRNPASLPENAPEVRAHLSHCLEWYERLIQALAASMGVKWPLAQAHFFAIRVVNFVRVTWKILLKCSLNNLHFK